MLVYRLTRTGVSICAKNMIHCFILCRLECLENPSSSNLLSCPVSQSRRIAAMKISKLSPKFTTNCHCVLPRKKRHHILSTPNPSWKGSLEYSKLLLPSPSMSSKSTTANAWQCVVNWVQTMLQLIFFPYLFDDTTYPVNDSML